MILKNCFQAMEKTKSKATTTTTTSTTMTVNDASQGDNKQNKNNPKLLIIDLIMPEGNKPFIGKFIDIVMLALTHKGRIRTEKEFHKLLNSSGFIITKIIHQSDNDNFLSIIEATSSSSSSSSIKSYHMT